MKQILLLTVGLICLAATGLVQAQEGELHGVVDLTYQSKYVWRGFDIFADKSAMQGLVDIDLLGTGFGVSVMAHRAASSGFENGERWDYTLYYQNQLFAEENYATNYRLGWVYYNYPDNPTKGDNVAGATNASLQEVHAILSMPKFCPMGVVPSYVLIKMWPSESGSYSGARSSQIAELGGTASGFAHVFMLDYALPIESLLPEIPEHILNFHSELVYNDGVGPAGQNVDNDWSNVVFGVSTDFDLGGNVTLTPGIYHQVTFESTVNDDKDETWVTLGLKYKF